MGRHRTTGAELARAIGEPQASLQRRLSGRYPFDVDLLAQIADYFGVPVTSFFPAQTARSVPTGEYGGRLDRTSRHAWAAVGNLAA